MKIDEIITNKMKAICFYCSHETMVSEMAKECEICYSKNFLIENQFAIIKVIAQGGFGRVFKCFHFPTNTYVAIKERKDEKNIEQWKKEIEMMKMIENQVSCLIFPRIISVLDDIPSKSPQKYIVMEVVDGGSMKGFNQNFLKTHSFSEEKHFIEMILSFLFQLKILHENGYIHRDIKPGKI